MSRTVLAIDPGANGAIVWQRPGGVPAVYNMPETDADLYQVIESAIEDLSPIERSARCIACLEEVPTGMPGKGAAMAKLNRNYGIVRGILTALHVRIELVRPAKWQKHFSLGTRAGCASDNEWKNKLKAEAQRRFPGIKVTLANADALLILDWALHINP